jgi:polyvinyl alcohol dehydrogenase (cytochrome)
MKYLLAGAVLSLVSLGGTAAAQSPGETPRQPDALYAQYCANCHEGAVARAPRRDALALLTPDVVHRALTTGTMSAQAHDLSPAEIDALSRFVGRATPAVPTTVSTRPCGADVAPLTADAADGPRWLGWGATLDDHRFQSAPLAGLAADDVPRLKLKWAFGFPGVNRANAQPAVFGGRVFVGSAGTTVYSLSASTGCQVWAFTSVAPVRTAVSIGPSGDGGWTAYFGDQAANVYAVDASTGTLRWKRRVDDFTGAIITGSPVLADGVLYAVTTSAEEVLGASSSYECCRFRGSVSALDAATGDVRWQSYTIPDAPKPTRKNAAGVQMWGPSGAGVWSAPTIDLAHHRLYVTTGDGYSDPVAPTTDAFLAFALDTGRLLWSRQMTSGDAYNVACGLPGDAGTNCPEARGPDFDFGSSPMLIDLGNGHRALVAGQKSGFVHAVDPDHDGAILWQTRVGTGGTLGGVQWGTAYDGSLVFAALSDVQIEGAPPGEAGAQPTMLGIPLRLNSAAGGGLFALDPATGRIVWHTPHPGCGDHPGCSPAQSAAVTAMPGVVFSGGLDGHLRAYASRTGEIIWDVDTAHSYDTVNGVAATGGALDGPGPVVAGGTVFVNSGYAFMGGMPGNVLLAFSVDGK